MKSIKERVAAQLRKLKDRIHCKHYRLTRTPMRNDWRCIDCGRRV